MTTANRDQQEFWNGPGAKRWVSQHEVLDRMVRPFGLAAQERLELRPGESVLDVGCGCGDSVAQLLRAVAPGGSVTGVDISAPMLERARQVAPGATLIVGDASREPLPQAFDAIFSRFGVMFFDDPTAAFRHLRDSLREPGKGRLGFVCWREVEQNAWAQIPFSTVRAALPNAAPDFTYGSTSAPGPYALADRDFVTRILRDAGFGAVDLEPFDPEVELSTTGLADAVEMAMTAGPAARLLSEATPEERERARAALMEAFAPYLDGERVAMPSSAWLVLAR